MSVEIKSGIYKIINLINGKRYIGSSCDIKARWRNHKNTLLKNNHDNSYLQRAFNKYSIENFKFEVIEFIEDKSKLIEREQYYLDTLNPEYNICKKAESRLGATLSKEIKEKISLSLKGIKRSEETKRKISLSKRGKLSNRQNYKHSEETRRKIGEKSKGRKHSKESREKMSLIRKEYYENKKGNNNVF